MVYLPVKSKRKGYKLVGVSMPLQASNYLQLFATAKGISKSKILSELITNFIASGENEESLYKTLAQRIDKEWSKRKKKHPALVWADYKRGLVTELTKKGLNEEQITKVLNDTKKRRK